MFRFIILGALVSIAIGAPRAPQSREEQIRKKILDESMVGIYTKEGKIICAGALIQHDFVVTVAEPLQSFEANQLNIRIGKLNRNVQKIIIHEDYNKQNYFKNNVVLLKLTKSFINEGIVLATNDSQTTYIDNCIVGNWENKNSDTQVNFVDYHICEEHRRQINRNILFDFHSSQDCINSETNKQQLCETMLGSPIICRKTSSADLFYPYSQYNLFGLTTTYCDGVDSDPVITVDLQSQSEWINRKINDME